jgi:hypothetical protein
LPTPGVEDDFAGHGWIVTTGDTTSPVTVGLRTASVGSGSGKLPRCSITLLSGNTLHF